MGFIIKNNITYGGGGNSGVELTQEEYNALSEEDKLDGTIYYITDGEPSIFLELDTTLTKEGKAPDSKVVGDKINILSNSINGLTFLPLSESEYNALETKDDNTVYLVYEDPEEASE